MSITQYPRALLAVVLALPLTMLASLGAWLTMLLLHWPSRRAMIFPRAWGRGICRMAGVDVMVEGAEHLQDEATYIFAGNHASQFDIFCFQGYFPHDFRWIAKKELFRIPLFGPAMRSVGSIAIDRGHGREAMKSLEQAARSIAAGTSVLIFPEGTRSPDGRLREFKTGAILLAMRAGVPVVPLAFIGTHAILPKGRRLPRPGRVIIRIGSPIDPHQYRAGQKQELARHLRQQVAALLEGAENNTTFRSRQTTDNMA
ncbi:MAG: 1-acyl-sn-glycerol-3-phosphate acyltransferase [Desulfobulbaceae bacterium A2]|nr:MAG: 1-acyl-sn-glycerol-3-phosphate acyltransferase [Desulfobulbaceae bacterium A2]